MSFFEYSHNEYCKMLDKDICSSNCEYELWAPVRPRNDIDNLAFSVYNCSLENIARDLANDPSADQEEVCNRWGRSLDNLTDSEIKYIENTIKEYS